MPDEANMTPEDRLSVSSVEGVGGKTKFETPSAVDLRRPEMRGVAGVAEREPEEMTWSEVMRELKLANTLRKTDADYLRDNQSRIGELIRRREELAERPEAKAELADLKVHVKAVEEAIVYEADGSADNVGLQPNWKRPMQQLNSELAGLQQQVSREPENDAKERRREYLAGVGRTVRLAVLSQTQVRGYEVDPEVVYSLAVEHTLLDWGGIKTDTEMLLEQFGQFDVRWQEIRSPGGLKKREAAVAASASNAMQEMPAVEIREKAGFVPLFQPDGDFVRRYGLPAEVKYYTGRGVERVSRKIQYLLTDALVRSNVAPLDTNDFVNTAGADWIDGFKPVFSFFGRVKGGSWKNMTGESKDETASAMGGMNFKDTSSELAKDKDIPTIVDILVAADGRLGDSFIMEPQHKELVKHLIDSGFRTRLGTPGSGADGVSQQEMKVWMDAQANYLSVQLKVERGVIDLARSMTAQMGYGVELRAERNVIAKTNKQEGDVPHVYKIVAEAEGETALKNSLDAIRIKGKAGDLATAYRDGGFVKMAEEAKRLEGGNEMLLWMAGRRAVTSALDEIQNMFDKKGQSLTATEKSKYIEKIQKSVDELCSPDIPFMKFETGVLIIEQAKLLWGEGEMGVLAAAAQPDAEEVAAAARGKAKVMYSSQPTIGYVTNLLGVGFLQRPIEGAVNAVRERGASVGEDADELVEQVEEWIDDAKAATGRAARGVARRVTRIFRRRP